MHTVLYIDDEQINLELLKFHMHKHCKILTGNSAQVGLEIIQREKDITHVLTDMKMPGLSGIEFIKEAKKIRPDIKYFLISAYSPTEEVERAIGLKLIYNYFQKPCDMAKVRETILAS